MEKKTNKEKKQSTKKKQPVKKNIKEIPKRTTKTTSKNKTENKRKSQTKIKNKPVSLKEKILNKNNILYYVFFGLLILVIILGIGVLTKSNDKTNETANIAIPIFEKATSNEMTIDLEELATQDEYSMKITNYRFDKVNKEKIEYTITISNESEASIKVTKDDNPTNLIKNQELTRIEGVSLKANEKDYAIYHFSVIDKKKVKKDDKIIIKIDSLQ